MNLILLDPKDFLSETIVKLGPRRAQHIRKVLRSEIGDALQVGKVGGLMGEGIVTELSRDSALLSVSLDTPPPPPLDVTLVLALPRPKVFRRIFQNAVSMGVKKIVLLHTARVEKSYWQTPFLEADEVERQIRLGLEQAMDTVFPDIETARRFRPFVEDRLPELLKGRIGYLAHPGMGGAFPARPLSPALLLVGPEGGFIPFEVDLLMAQKVRPHDLGARILKVETAVPTLLSRFISMDC